MTIFVDLLVGLGATATVATAIVTAAANIAFAVAISYAASELFGPDSKGGTAPSDRTFVTKSPSAPRVRAYGRVKLSGNQAFAVVRNGNLYRVLTHGEGPIDGVEEHWIDDNPIEVDGVGAVTTAKYIVDGAPRVFAHWHLGGASGQHYGALEDVFAEWDDTHLGKGVHHSLVVLSQVKQERFTEVFPNYDRTNYAQLIRGARVYDPREAAHDPADASTWEWSPNAVLCILDFLRHEAGLAFPWLFIEPELDAWIATADVADEQVPVLGGDTQPRYRLAGAYDYAERRADVLGRMLVTCDGRLMVGQNGGIRLALPSAAEPTVTITGDAILSYSLGSGNEAPDVATVIKAQYQEPDFGYVETDAEPWENTDLVTAFGVLVEDLPLTMVPSHAQARRLMKLAAARAAPEWRGRITTNLLALPAVAERYVRLVIDETEIDMRVEITRCQFRLGEGGVVLGLFIDWMAADPAALEFDAATEEGRVPERGPSPSGSNALPVPPDFDVVIAAETSGALTYPVAVASWTDLGTDSLTVELFYKIVGGSGDELRANTSSENDTLTVGPLIEGVEYQFRARTRSATERVGASTGIVTATATIDVVPPGVPTSPSVSEDSGTVTITWVQPTSANTAGANVYRATTSAFGTAAEVGTVYGGPGTSLAFDDVPTTGTYWYWVVAINASFLEGAEAPAGSITVA